MARKAEVQPEMLSAASNPHLSAPALASGRLLYRATVAVLALTARFYGPECPVGQILAATADCLREL